MNHVRHDHDGCGEDEEQDRADGDQILEALLAFGGGPRLDCVSADRRRAGHKRRGAGCFQKTDVRERVVYVALFLPLADCVLACFRVWSHSRVKANTNRPQLVSIPPTRGVQRGYGEVTAKGRYGATVSTKMLHEGAPGSAGEGGERGQIKPPEGSPPGGSG